MERRLVEVAKGGDGAFGGGRLDMKGGDCAPSTPLPMAPSPFTLE